MPLDRRQLIVTGIAAATAGPAFAQEGAPVGAAPMPPVAAASPTYDPPQASAYTRAELVTKVSDFFGVTAEAAAAVIEKVFREHGQPTGYVAGEEASAAFGVGVRYGKGLLYMKNQEPSTVYWQGPSLGWDFGGNASRVFTMAYGLMTPDGVFRRFPGVEGSAYIVGGMGVNYQKAEDIVLAPIRAGVGLRLGANIGYLAYSRRRNWFPV